MDDPHRRRRGRHGDARRRARRPVPTPSPTPTARSATRSAADRAGAGPPVRRAAARAVHTTSTRSPPRWTTIVATAQLGRRAGRLRRRRGVRRRRGLPDPGHAGADRGAARPATTPGSRSTTARSSSGATDCLTVHDYLWRWDTDWFWCSRAFGAQNPRVRRLLAAALAAQRRLLPADRGSRTATASPPGSTGCAAGRARERVVQDVEIPVGAHGRVPALVPARGRRSSRSGCARCAARHRRSRRGWPLVPAGSRATPTSTSASGRPSPIAPGARRRRRQPRHRGGRSPSSAATSRCTPTPTTTRRSSAACTAARPTPQIKKTYDPDGRLPGLYDKAVRRR